MIVLVVCEILISNFDCYKKYLLLFAVMNGLYFGLTVAKLIVTTMSKHSYEIPTKESIFYLLTILIGLAVPSIEFPIIMAQITFIVLYYIRYFGSVVIQLMRELNIKTF